MLEIQPIPAFNDNYIWAIQKEGRKEGRNTIWVVDPGDADPVIAYLDRNNATLGGILITHHHKDHTGGVSKLKQLFDVQTYGADVPGCTDQVMAEGDTLDLFDSTFQVLSLAGHTLDHIGFYAPSEQILFCGDTLFFAGCGRIFEGSAEQMYQALNKLAALPDETRVFAAHEYTQANLAFALAVEPDNPHIIRAQQQAERLRARKSPTLPTTIGAEKCHNPFLRSHQPPVIAAAMEQSGSFVVDPVEVFAAVRQWKDNF